MWPPKFRKHENSESKEEEFSVPGIQLSNKTPPVCNTIRIIPDGEEPYKVQAEKKKLDGTTRREPIFSGPTFNGNPEEYQNGYRITIKNIRMSPMCLRRITAFILHYLAWYFHCLQ